MDIKETKEALKAIEILAVGGIKMVKAPEMGEKITIALDVIKEADKVIEGVKGIELIDDEVKDIDQAELLELGTIAYSLVKKIVAEAKAKEVV